MRGMTETGIDRGAFDQPTPVAKQVWPVDPHNWYVEPAACTAQLIEQEGFLGRSYDPACGQGNIVETLIAMGGDAFGTDVVRRTDAPWFKGVRDFLAPGSVAYHDNLICNPPFFRAKGTEAFIRRALAVTPGKIAIFTDMKFLAGSRRANGLYREARPARVYIITPRPSCPPGEYLKAGNKAAGADYCWIVWDKTAPSTGTSMLWLTKDGADDD